MPPTYYLYLEIYHKFVILLFSQLYPAAGSHNFRCGIPPIPCEKGRHEVSPFALSPHLECFSRGGSPSLVQGMGFAPLAVRIRAKPHHFVGQEQVALSTAPVFVGNQIQPSHTVLRGYLCAHGASYAVIFV